MKDEELEAFIIRLTRERSLKHYMVEEKDNEDKDINAGMVSVAVRFMVPIHQQEVFRAKYVDKPSRPEIIFQRVICPRPQPQASRKRPASLHSSKEFLSRCGAQLASIQPCSCLREVWKRGSEVSKGNGDNSSLVHSRYTSFTSAGYS